MQVKFLILKNYFHWYELHIKVEFSNIYCFYINITIFIYNISKKFGSKKIS